MQSEARAMRRSGAFAAGDDAERGTSDEEERRV
jgi:hypothetical protein